MNVLAECRNYNDLRLALRERYKELRITNEAIDEISGCQAGYSTKIIGPNPTKRLGPVSWNLLETLGVKLLVVEDKAARERTEGRYKPKSETFSNAPALASPEVTPEVRRFFRAIAPLGARAAAEQTTPAQRRKWARRAARARWSR